MNETQKTLNALKAAQINPIADDIAKAYTQSGSATTGITYYDLEAPAKLLFPVLTPLRNRIPRVVGGAGIQANWKAVTGINTNNMSLGIQEGSRGGVINQTTQDYFAKFASLGLENYVTFEADYAAKGFDDVKALSTRDLLQATMIKEENLDYNGNATLALGKTLTPSASSATTGGSIAAGTYLLTVVALTQDGYQQVAGLNNGTTNQSFAQSSAQLRSTITKADLTGYSYSVNAGVAQYSDSASITTTGSTSVISATVTATPGAVAYAWFLGTAGNQVLTAVTSINSVAIKALSVSTWNLTNLSNTDCSVDSTVYDGILTQIFKPNSGSYVKALPTGTAGVGSKLTSDGAGGIVEIDDALTSFYNNYKISPDTMYVSVNVFKQISSLVIANNGAPLVRFAGDFNNSTSLTAGVAVVNYYNKITGNTLKIQIHPNAAPGTIMFFSESIPYPLSNVGNVLVKKLRRDYYQMEWPLRTRRYEYGVYFDGVLQNYFPPAFGIIYNIAE